jgi:phosphate-selective porin
LQNVFKTSRNLAGNFEIEDAQFDKLIEIGTELSAKEKCATSQAVITGAESRKIRYDLNVTTF